MLGIYIKARVLSIDKTESVCFSVLLDNLLSLLFSIEENQKNMFSLLFFLRPNF